MDKDPGNSGWQRDLVVSHWKLTDLAEQQNDHDQARRHLEAALLIVKELEATNRLSPRYALMVDAIEERLASLIEPAAGQ